MSTTLTDKTKPPILVLNEADHAYTLGGKPIPGVTEILKGAGLIDDRFYTGNGAERGRAVHKACQFINEDSLDRSSLDPRIAAYVKGYENFLAASGFVPVMWEYSVANETYWYAGTIDIIGWMNDVKTLIDIKTGSLPKTVGLQLAAYQRAMPNHHKYQRFSLLLRDPGGFSLHPHTDPNDFEIFTSALNLYRWRNS